MENHHRQSGGTLCWLLFSVCAISFFWENAGTRLVFDGRVAFGGTCLYKFMCLQCSPVTPKGDNRPIKSWHGAGYTQTHTHTGLPRLFVINPHLLLMWNSFRRWCHHPCRGSWWFSQDQIGTTLPGARLLSDPSRGRRSCNSQWLSSSHQICKSKTFGCETVKMRHLDWLRFIWKSWVQSRWALEMKIIK